ncbi:hypothetical protein AM501_30075 [Aneurinibacillus migulanus]|uniref:DMT family transporter n=1 Tax=Aneurinibacillus migulanus TaxID=47500 RepID=UPI0005B90778|nr:multidrug efflux SMR transporter [Aneurinibacillus migulanus]KIV53227.1 hypothetical protein TS64_19780 [Aneurinibacillus migulanus]KPD04738.1 hypothetical protein AM501_30075 [Aneurinibacillus migulanus]MCP1358703.1 multidrug efflux SMR transporter [Aneurinibacillus migulanus]MED4730846.1 multidrug efflux SMR transporter [Aneurinibacillus migulanus]
MAWIFLIFAGIAEIVGVICLKLAEGFTRLKPTIAFIAVGGMSLYLLSLALRTIPIGTAYGIWTGIGSVGTVLAGMLFFKEPKDIKRLLLISCIIIGIIGLKVTSGH